METICKGLNTGAMADIITWIAVEETFLKNLSLLRKLWLVFLE